MSRITGYIGEYTIQNAMITPKSVENMIIPPEITNIKYYAITNNYNLISPNKKDQVLILTSDNKYIVFVDFDTPNKKINEITSLLYILIKFSVEQNKVYLFSEFVNMGGKINQLLISNDSMPVYAKNDTEFNAEIKKLENVRESNDKASKAYKATLDLLKRKNPDNIDLNMLNLFILIAENTDKKIPDTYCFQFDNISPSNPIAEYSCVVRKNASSLIANNIPSNAPSNGLSPLVIVGIVLGVIVIICYGYVSYQEFSRFNKSTSSDSSSSRYTSSDTPINPPTNVQPNINNNTSGGYYYYKI